MAISRDLHATVLVPTFDHGPTLNYSVGSALRQTVGEIEVLIVGDGMPDEAREVALGLARSDDRVRVLDNPKGEHHGELHRHAALAQARGRYVFYLSDDDLWFPEHIEAMSATFEATGADFVHAPPVWRMPGGGLQRWIVDFAVPRYRQMIFERANRVALSSGAHTLAAYRRLPEGWLVTPPGEFVDAWMWRRFAEQPDTVFACSTRPTVMHLPSKLREGWTPEERLAELADCAGMLEDPARRIDYLAALVASEHERLLFLETQATELEAWVADRQRALDSVLAQKQELADEVAMMRGSRRWRVGEQVKRELRRFSRP